MWKKILVIVLCLIVGGAIGTIATMAYFGHGVAQMMLMLQEKEIFRIGEAADNAYYEQAGETAIWALTFYIETLNELKVERSCADVENPYLFVRPEDDLTLSHIKLIKLYKQAGNEEKVKYHFTEAKKHGELSLFKYKKFDSIDDCLAFLEKLDGLRKKSL